MRGSGVGGRSEGGGGIGKRGEGGRRPGRWDEGERWGREEGVTRFEILTTDFY